MLHVSAERRLILGFVLACLSCTGRDIVLGDRRDENGRDAGDSDASETDGGRPLPPFTVPEPIGGISTDDSVDDDPSLSADLTLLYFNSEREGGLGEEDIWYSQRTRPSDAWSVPQLATELNSERRETGIALSADGLTIWFSSDRDDEDGTLDIFTATRMTRDEPFSAPQRVDALSSDRDDLVSAFDSGSDTLYLARRDEGADYDLYAAQRSGDAFSEPRALSGLNGAGEESDAFALSARHLLFFTRDEELVVATRAAGSEPFELAFALDELNSADDDRDAWVSQDLSYLVFSSNRSGAYRLYEARR